MGNQMGNCLGSREKKRENGLTSMHSGTVGAQTKSHVIDGLLSGLVEGTKSNGSTSVLLTVKVPSSTEKMTILKPMSEGDILLSPNLKGFTLAELKNVTQNFRPDNLIGEGGFGCVYKGWLDDQTFAAARPGHGTVVAVKMLQPEGFQGHKEWMSEVNYLGQLHHPNLVKLVGYCSEGENRLLVYEYMSRGSLENHLFRRGAQPLSWQLRIKVAIGAARGLSFLHDSEQPIIYRDFKASNILLDSEFNAKLSDFGLAKAGPTGDRTHVSTQVMGTQGYAAPEYIATGRLTARCDVYSFGVVLLELLTGRRAVDKSKVGVEQNLVEWARPYLGDKRKLFRVMDTKLEGQYPQKEAYMVALLALHCISEAKLRPQMAEVVAMLEEVPRVRRGNSTLRTDQHSAPTPTRSPLKYNDLSSPNITPRGSPATPQTKSTLLKCPEAR